MNVIFCLLPLNGTSAIKELDEFDSTHLIYKDFSGFFVVVGITAF